MRTPFLTALLSLAVLPNCSGGDSANPAESMTSSGGESAAGGMVSAAGGVGGNDGEMAAAGSEQGGGGGEMPEVQRPWPPTQFAQISAPLSGGIRFDSTIQLTFSGDIDTLPDLTTAFDVWADGKVVGIQSVAIKANDPRTLRIELAEPIQESELVTLSFDASAALSADSVALARFVDTEVPLGYELFLLIGQSNMAGRGPLADAPAAALPNAWLLDSEGGWESASHPLNRYSTIRKDLGMQEAGPGYSFAQVVADDIEREVGLVVNARGGSAAAEWQKGDAAGYYEEALQRAILGERGGKLRAMVWHQGESDAAMADAWTAKISSMVSDFRTDLLAPELPFIAGQIGTFVADSAAINAVILDLPNQISFTAAVTSEELTDKGDSLHFDAASQHTLGERYASATLSLVYP